MLAKRLTRGDTIAIFSPSSPATVFAPTRYRRAKRFMEKKGFRIFEGNLTGKSDVYRSGTIKERADELNALIRNDEVSCIMATIGGLNSNSLLPYIDYPTIRKKPKIFIGYSDVTALLLAIYAKTGLVTYYGPAMVASFGEFLPLVDETFQYFSDICMEKQKLPFVLPTPTHWTDEFVDWETQTKAKPQYKNTLVTLHGGKSEGRLIGGNLNTMYGIWATEYLPEILPGDILLIEDSMKSIGEVERAFSHLKLCGVFEKISGLILGKHEKFDDQGTGRKPYDVLREIMGEIRIPVLCEFDCCHTHPMLTVPIGRKVRLDADRQTVTLLEKYIEE